MSQTNYPTRNGIIILDEDDCDSAGLSHLEQSVRSLQYARNTGQDVPVIDLTLDEKEQKGVHEYEIQIIEQLEEVERNNPNYCRRLPVPLRNPLIPTRSKISSFRHKSMVIKQGTLVEVPQRAQNEYNWQFLHVSDIYTDTWSRVILRGIRLTRNRNLRGMLPRMKNEVCALYDINKEDNRPEHIQAAVEILVTEVVRTRALSKTNAAFPTHRFDPRQWNSMEEIENKGVLVQRWKYSRYWPTPGAMATKRPLSGALVRLRSVDIEDEYFRVADDKLRNEFRGGIIRGGSSKGARVSIPCIDLDMAKDDRDAILTLGHNQKYTADDMFCGAGGASW